MHVSWEKGLTRVSGGVERALQRRERRSRSHGTKEREALVFTKMEREQAEEEGDAVRSLSTNEKRAKRVARKRRSWQELENARSRSPPERTKGSMGVVGRCSDETGHGRVGGVPGDRKSVGGGRKPETTTDLARARWRAGGSTRWKTGFGAWVHGVSERKAGSGASGYRPWWRAGESEGARPR